MSRAGARLFIRTKLHSFKTLRIFSQSRIARAATGILVLAAAAFAHYGLANVRVPVNVETIAIFSPATVRLGQEELVIEGPAAPPVEGMLFSHDGRPNEIVDVSFDRARLDEQTISKFQGVGLMPPLTSAAIDYRAQEPEKSVTGDETCRTRVELRSLSKMPDEIRLFQLEAPGMDHYRHLELTASGAELVSNVIIDSPSAAYREPGCQKILKVGDWNQSSSIDVSTIVDDDSSLRFSFKPLTTNSTLWDGTEGLFEPFDLGVQKLEPGDPQAFQARAVTIRQLGVNARSVPVELASARSASNAPLLAISGLKIGSDQLQLSITGKGLVKIKGEDITVNILNRAQDNKILAALLTALDAALLAWAARFILKKPSPSTQPRQPRGRIRRLARLPRGNARK